MHVGIVGIVMRQHQRQQSGNDATRHGMLASAHTAQQFPPFCCPADCCTYDAAGAAGSLRPPPSIQELNASTPGDSPLDIHIKLLVVGMTGTGALGNINLIEVYVGSVAA